MIQQDSASDHNRQGQEKPGAVELPQTWIFQLVDTLQVPPAAGSEDNQSLENTQPNTQYNK